MSLTSPYQMSILIGFLHLIEGHWKMSPRASPQSKLKSCAPVVIHARFPLSCSGASIATDALHVQFLVPLTSQCNFQLECCHLSP